MAKASDSLEPTASLADQTRAAAVKDRQTAASGGKSLDGLVEGSVFREVPRISMNAAAWSSFSIPTGLAAS